MKQAIETARMEADRAEREGRYDKVAELRYGTIAQLEKDLKNTKEELAEIQKGRSLLKEEVEAEEIADIVDRKSTRLNSSHVAISYAVFCLKKKKKQNE